MKHTLPFILTLSMMCTDMMQTLAMDSYPPVLKVGIHRERTHMQSRGVEADQPPYIPVLLQVDDYGIEDTLKSMGVIIYGKRDHILLTSIPRDSLENVLGLPQTINAEMTTATRVQLDVARPMCHADVLQEGIASLPHAYDGTGVVVGFSDIGFDARHIAFKDRISAIYNYNARYGTIQKAETSEEIAAWTTDNPDEYHATHVGNILGGDYRGAPYWGAATGAEMVATTSTLTDVGILAGVEDIIAYAKNQDKRAVINLSLASFLGPHDGSSLVCRYLTACAEDAVICLAAGNKGNTQCYATAALTDSSTIKRVAINDLATWTGKSVEGATDVWSADSQPFALRIEVYDKDTRSIVYTTDWTSPAETDDETNTIYVSSAEDTEFARFMEGEIYACAGISPLNGRYYAETEYMVSTSATQATSDGKWARYAVCIAVKGAPQNTGDVANVQFFADASSSFIGSASGFEAPTFSHDGSISDLCTARGVISVGNCNSRNSAPSLYGEDGIVTWSFDVGKAEINSSYSTSPYIGRYPHFSAPGNMVVSAYSGEYAKTHPSESPDITAVTTIGSDKYYWIAASGTSMSSPLAAGIIAMWLQANPSLSTDEIIEIAQSTASTDYTDITDPRWGAGCIDALAGARKVIEMAGIPDVATTDTRVIRNPNGSITAPEGTMIYTLDGIEISKHNRLPKGIYIIRLPDGHTYKML